MHKLELFEFTAHDAGDTKALQSYIFSFLILVLSVCVSTFVPSKTSASMRPYIRAAVGDGGLRPRSELVLVLRHAEICRTPYIRMCVCVWVSVCICVYLCVSVCICV